MSSFVNWDNNVTKKFLAASNLHLSPNVIKLYIKELIYLYAKNSKSAIKISLIVTAKKIASFGEIAGYEFDYNNVVNYILIPSFGSEWRNKCKLTCMDIDVSNQLFSVDPFEIHDADIIHFLGGNTFYLLDAFSNPKNIDNINKLQRWLTNDREGLLFGQSAGAICGSDVDAAAAIAKAISHDKLINNSYPLTKHLKLNTPLFNKSDIRDEDLSQYIEKYFLEIDENTAISLKYPIFDLSTNFEIVEHVPLTCADILLINSKYYLNAKNLNTIGGDLISYIFHKLHNGILLDNIKLPENDFFLDAFPNSSLVPHYNPIHDIAIENSSKLLSTVQTTLYLIDNNDGYIFSEPNKLGGRYITGNYIQYRGIQY